MKKFLSLLVGMFLCFTAQSFGADCGDRARNPNTGLTDCVGSSGGEVTPGGSDKYIQFNDGGSTFGGSSRFQFDKTTSQITLDAGSGSGISFLMQKLTAGDAYFTQVYSSRFTSFGVNALSMVTFFGDTEVETLTGNDVTVGINTSGGFPVDIESPLLVQGRDSTHIFLKAYPGSPASGSVSLKTDDDLSSDLTFSFPNASGTVAVIGGNSWTGTQNFSGATTTLPGVVTVTTTASAPGTCAIGDLYVDTSGAYCACTSSNTWTNITPLTGSCT